jgi:hypothetical protein
LGRNRNFSPGHTPHEDRRSQESTLERGFAIDSAKASRFANGIEPLDWLASAVQDLATQVDGESSHTFPRE